MKTTIITAIATILFTANTYATRTAGNFLPSNSDSSAACMVSLPSEDEMYDALSEAIIYENSRKSVSLPTEAQMHGAITIAFAYENGRKCVSLPSEAQMHDALTSAIVFEKGIKDRNKLNLGSFAKLSK